MMEKERKKKDGSEPKKRTRWKWCKAKDRGEERDKTRAVANKSPKPDLARITLLRKKVYRYQKQASTWAKSNL